MKDITSIQHFPPLEDLVSILMKKTQNQNPHFFRILVAYYFTKIASTMRVSIKTHDRGIIPVNMYAINLAVSGSGKGYSTNIVEDRIISKFKNIFLNHTFLSVSGKNIAKIAVKRASRDQLDPDDVRATIEADFASLGEFKFSFDSGTPPAIKQMRHKLLLANAGSVNLEIDEIASNLVGNTDVLITFLELFDIGKIKDKLTKNTADNKRIEEVEGHTPTNMMLYGTPIKLLTPGTKTEEEFYTMLEIGFARRCFFGLSRFINSNLQMTPEQLYKINTDPQIDKFINNLSFRLSKLADEINFGMTLTMSKSVALIINEYYLDCQRAAASISEHQEVRRAELQHRYYKSMKLAGTYAFISGNNEIKEEHIYQAIKLAEESGESFKQILEREKPHKALAKYIVQTDEELTVVDLMDNLAFYKGPEAARRDLMTRAIAYGYKNNMVIKNSFTDGIEFFTGETLEETDLNKLTISWSKDITEDFKQETGKFTQLHKIIKKNGLNYTAHGFVSRYRTATNAIPGFNLAIIDVDEGIDLKAAKMLLKDYQAIFATTKSHTSKVNRFRIILPLSHIIKLDTEDYSKFMVNVYNWLPFKVDTATKDISRVWASFNGNYYEQDGKLLDALKFIPNTNAEAKQTKKIEENADLNNLERWFLLNINIGNRNNQLIRYALALADAGKDAFKIRQTLHQFNSKLKFSLPEEEINNTIMQTVIKRIQTK